MGDDGTTTRVQYVDRGEAHLRTVESSIVPEVDSIVQIGEDEYQVYHVTHTLVESGHTATVFCWSVTDDRAEYIEQMVEQTLRNQRSKHAEWNDMERERESDGQGDT